MVGSRFAREKKSSIHTMRCFRDSTTALEQGRFTWRHDSILKSIITFMSDKLRPGFQLFSDLEGFQAPGGGSIPPNILTTTLRPDLFLVDESRSLLILFELTSPWETNIDRNHTYKEAKYAPLVADLSRNFTVLQFSVEISARGFITKPNKARLKAFSLKCCEVGNAHIKRLISTCSKAAILSSFSIFRARNEPSWTSPSPLVVRTEH